MQGIAADYQKTDTLPELMKAVQALVVESHPDRKISPLDNDPEVDTLISLFDEVFFTAFQTRLIRGTDEPVYLPADEHIPFHRIVFAHGFFSSALHEIAHWCIAGPERRLLEDYGYWYCPDGRDAQQQKAFESVEIKPQAVEWALTLAAGRHFRVSTDNLNGAEPDREGFTQAVYAQLLSYMQNGFPPRAQQLLNALHKQFCTPPLTLHYIEALAP